MREGTKTPHRPTITSLEEKNNLGREVVGELEKKQSIYLHVFLMCSIVLYVH